MTAPMGKDTKEIIRPNPNDIILGRSREARVHLGNVKYRKLIDTKKSEYAIAKRRGKKVITIKTLNELRRSGARFLKQDEASGRKFDIGDDKALIKVSQALRENQQDLQTKLKRELGDKVIDNDEKKNLQDILFEPLPVPTYPPSSSYFVSEGSHKDWKHLEIQLIDAFISEKLGLFSGDSSSAGGSPRKKK